MFATFEVTSSELGIKGPNSIISIDSPINSLSWMSKSTFASQHKSSPLLDKFIYYQEGWLASGNVNSMVGCTFTTTLTEQQNEWLKARDEKLKEAAQASTQSQPSTAGSLPSPVTTAPVASPTNGSSSLAHNLNRTNFNLRGHKSEIKFVKWNEPYQKLASCDSKGVIFVWIKYEGRWSIELINERGSSVSDFAWSHDGRNAAICYQDG
jgi:hypothetical protein